MIEAKCKNCKHWLETLVLKDYRPCKKINYAYDYHEVFSDSDNEDRAILVTSGDAWQGISPDLLTGPEFGCILFEQRK